MFFTKGFEHLARQTGFVQRKSKFRAQDLIALAVFLDDDLSVDSLTRLCSQLDATNRVSMSTEGLNERFNPEGVALLRALFSELLQEKLKNSSLVPCKLDTLFRRIRILDSTVFQLPDEYTDCYQGCGSSHTAGIKIQLEYELKTGRFMQIDVGSGKITMDCTEQNVPKR